MRERIRWKTGGSFGMKYQRLIGYRNSGRGNRGKQRIRNLAAQGIRSIRKDSRECNTGIRRDRLLQQFAHEIDVGNGRVCVLTAQIDIAEIWTPLEQNVFRYSSSRVGSQVGHRPVVEKLEYL